MQTFLCTLSRKERDALSALESLLSTALPPKVPILFPIHFPTGCNVEWSKGHDLLYRRTSAFHQPRSQNPRVQPHPELLGGKPTLDNPPACEASFSTFTGSGCKRNQPSCSHEASHDALLILRGCVPVHLPLPAGVWGLVAAGGSMKERDVA